MILGAKRAGEQGIKVAGRVARLVSNLGGQFGGFIADESISVRSNTNAGAVRKLARRLGWDETAWLAAYDAEAQ